MQEKLNIINYMYGEVYLHAWGLEASTIFLDNAMDNKLNIQRKRTIKISDHFFEAITLASVFHNELNTCNLYDPESVVAFVSSLFLV
jgi:hypothetical protein